MQTDATIEEARRLWREIGRDNLMVKVPGDAAGPAGDPGADRRGRQHQHHAAVLAEGLCAKLPRPTSRAWKSLSRNGGDPHKVASVASFFVSRIDTLVDEALDKKIAAANDPAEKARLKGLQGKVAIANAKLAYQMYQQHLQRRALAAAGAARRADAAPAVGQHRHQEQGLQRRALCRGADRPRHRQHDAAGDDGRVPRPRPAARRASKRTSPGAETAMATLGGGRASRSTRSPRGLSRTGCACSPRPPTSSTPPCRKSAGPCSAASSMR